MDPRQNEQPEHSRGGWEHQVIQESGPVVPLALGIWPVLIWNSCNGVGAALVELIPIKLSTSTS